VYVASITIRQIDDSIKTRLRIRAASHGRSVEGEVREILKSVLNSEKPEQINFAESVRQRFAALGGVTLPDVVREPLRQAPVAGE
jgi:antitoxin FitA